MISIKASCIDSTNEPAVVFENEIQRLRDEGLKPEEQLTLEPYERDHAVVTGSYRARRSTTRTSTSHGYLAPERERTLEASCAQGTPCTCFQP